MFSGEIKAVVSDPTGGAAGRRRSTQSNALSLHRVALGTAPSCPTRSR